MGNQMKKITLLLVIIFTFLFSTTSWSEWSYVSENVDGDKYYYDKDRVIKSGKYHYFWMLTDYLKPMGGEFLSVTRYTQLDCSIFRYKESSISSIIMIGEMTLRDEWKYPQPESTLETLLNKVCEEHQ
jgi:hypothetical protein